MIILKIHGEKEELFFFFFFLKNYYLCFGDWTRPPSKYLLRTTVYSQVNLTYISTFFMNYFFFSLSLSLSFHLISPPTSFPSGLLPPASFPSGLLPPIFFLPPHTKTTGIYLIFQLYG